MKDPQTFPELVTFATWHVISGITKGVPIEETMHILVDFIVRWSKEQDSSRS